MILPLLAAASLCVPAQTAVELMVMTEVTAADARAGDRVRLRVHAPLTADGVVIVPEGAQAEGEVVAARRSGIAMRRGSLSVRVTRLMVDGREIALTGHVAAHARSGSDDALRLAIAPMWALIAANNSAKLKAGDIVTARLAAPLVAERRADGGLSVRLDPDAATAGCRPSS